MFQRIVGVLSVLLLVATTTRAEEADQPLKRAKVGDFVMLKMDNGPVKMQMRQEVTEVTDKNVTIKTITTINGMEQKPDVKTLPITSNYDPAVEQKNRKDFKIEDTGKGTETIKIAGKDYKCNWRSMTTTVNTNGMEIKTESKVWLSKDAPVFGLVKTETKTFGQTYVMELAESGNKK